ncbi:hypothetical protein, partial [Geobacter grbiciae]|uniref:hypothetical protein n=1 Tax=Geobacter grbiciae TaxID=155042 RepID=UPI001C029AC3
MQLKKQNMMGFLVVLRGNEGHFPYSPRWPSSGSTTSMLAEELEPVTGVDLSTMTISVMHQYAGNFADQSV